MTNSQALHPVPSAASIRVVPPRDGTAKRTARRVWRRTGIGRFCRQRDGAAAVEFALVVFPFVTLLIAMMEIGFIFLIGSTLDNGLETAMRQFYVQAETATTSQAASIRTELCRRMEFLVNCEAIKVDIAAYSSFQSIDTASPLDEATGTWRANFGTDHGCIAKGSIVVVQAGIAQKTFQNLGATKGTFSDGSRLISAAAVIQLDGNAASSSGC